MVETSTTGQSTSQYPVLHPPVTVSCAQCVQTAHPCFQPVHASSVGIPCGFGVVIRSRMQGVGVKSVSTVRDDDGCDGQAFPTKWMKGVGLSVFQVSLELWVRSRVHQTSNNGEYSLVMTCVSYSPLAILPRTLLTSIHNGRHTSREVGKVALHSRKGGWVVDLM